LPKLFTRSAVAVTDWGGGGLWMTGSCQASGMELAVQGWGGAQILDRADRSGGGAEWEHERRRAPSPRVVSVQTDTVNSTGRSRRPRRGCASDDWAWSTWSCVGCVRHLRYHSRYVINPELRILFERHVIYCISHASCVPGSVSEI
jgi:hypothetical protein